VHIATKKMRDRSPALSGLIGLASLLFSAMPVLAQTGPPLGQAGAFAVLGGSAVTNTGSTTTQGDLGIWPNTASSISGFPPGIVNGSVHAADAVAQQAQSDLTGAYDDLASRPCGTVLTGIDLGGLTLVPGVYCFASSAQLTGTLTLDAQGDPAAVFIFQMATTLTTASNARVQMTNGGSDCNVFWQVGSSATLGTGTALIGNVMALSSITANTGALISGRLLARNGAVTLDTNTVTRCGGVAGCPTLALSPVTLAAPSAGGAYQQTFTASGGTGPYVFSFGGTLPTGLSLVTSGPATALLSGTPLTLGGFSFVITAVDANDCPVSRLYSVDVALGAATGIPTLSFWAMAAMCAVLLLTAGQMLLSLPRRRVVRMSPRRR